MARDYEEVGYDELDELDAMLVEGDDDYEEVGARRPRGGPRRFKMFRGKRDIGRIAPIGFEAQQANIALGGGIGTFVGRPSRSTHLRQLLVDNGAAALNELTITSIRVGDEEQLLNGEVNATLYGADALAGGMQDNFSIIEANVPCTITIRNDGAAAATPAVSGRAQANRA